MFNFQHTQIHSKQLQQRHQLADWIFSAGKRSLAKILYKPVSVGTNLVERKTKIDRMKQTEEAERSCGCWSCCQDQFRSRSHDWFILTSWCHSAVGPKWRHFIISWKTSSLVTVRACRPEITVNSHLIPVHLWSSQRHEAVPVPAHTLSQSQWTGKVDGCVSVCCNRPTFKGKGGWKCGHELSGVWQLLTAPQTPAAIIMTSTFSVYYRWTLKGGGAPARTDDVSQHQNTWWTWCHLYDSDGTAAVHDL